MAPKSDLLQGTLDLRSSGLSIPAPCTAGHRVAHPAVLARRPPGQSRIALPALHRLEQQGLIAAHRATPRTTARRSSTSLRKSGRKQLAEETRTGNGCLTPSHAYSSSEWHMDPSGFQRNDVRRDPMLRRFHAPRVVVPPCGNERELDSELHSISRCSPSRTSAPA